MSCCRKAKTHICHSKTDVTAPPSHIPLTLNQSLTHSLLYYLMFFPYLDLYHIVSYIYTKPSPLSLHMHTPIFLWLLPSFMWLPHEICCSQFELRGFYWLFSYEAKQSVDTLLRDKSGYTKHVCLPVTTCLHQHHLSPRQTSLLFSWNYTNYFRLLVLPSQHLETTILSKLFVKIYFSVLRCSAGHHKICKKQMPDSHCF